jgi:alpha-amylase
LEFQTKSVTLADMRKIFVGILRILALGVSLAKPALADHQNGVMFQYFQWYTPSHGLWNELVENAPMLAKKGITALWLPPAYKAMNGLRDVGYGVYDRYDFGEFNQKGSVPTKYGTRAEFEAAVRAAHQVNLDVYGDVVMNHMVGPDGLENAPAVQVSPANRKVEIAGTDRTISAPTVFTFPGRGGKYSTFTWNWQDFTGVDADYRSRQRGIFKFRGPYGGFQEEVDHEHGNYDFLFGADLNMRNPAVSLELDHWGEWMTRTFALDGFRIDAVKHMPFEFISHWIGQLRAKLKSTANTSLFAVGEYWSGDLSRLIHYIDVTRGQLTLFDVPLHGKFHDAGDANGRYDMRTILDGTLMNADSAHAVTFVDNHDTQPFQALESPVADWFKPIAYAIILLRSEGYPCVFYADYFGATYTDRGRTAKIPNLSGTLDPMLASRRRFAWGNQHDYFDHPDVVGWTREGDAKHPGGMAVVVNDSRTQSGSKRMCLGPTALAGPREFMNVMDTGAPHVALDGQNCAVFRVGPADVAVWVDAHLLRSH